MFPVALSWGYCSTTTLRRDNAAPNVASAAASFLTPPVGSASAWILTAWLRAWITASRVSRSKSMAPFTALTRLGIRSWRRLSCTSICFQAFSVSPLSWISPLYAEMPQTTTATMRISRIHDMTRSSVGRRTARLGGRELVLLCGCRRLTLRLAQQPGGDQPDRVGHVLVGHAAADQGVFLVDVQLQAPGHGQPVPGPPSHLLGLGFGLGEERAQGASRPASWGGVVADQGQAGRCRDAGAERGRDPPLQHVAGQLGQLLGDGGEGGAFHLPELDGQHLQQVAIRVGGGGDRKSTRLN